MIVGALSDTHNRMTTVQAALELLLDLKAGYIIHCGDWTSAQTLQYITNFATTNNIPLAGVFGNRDNIEEMSKATADLTSRELLLPKDYQLLSLVIDDRDITVYHGHHKPTLRHLIEDAQYDALFTGHTHKPLIQTQENDSKLIINPGSTAFSIPRKKEPRSIATYDTSTNMARLIFFD